YIELDLVSFLEILGCLLVVDMITNLTGIYFERAAQVQERKGIAERADDKVERIGIYAVHSLMVFKMCEGTRSSRTLCGTPRKEFSPGSVFDKIHLIEDNFELMRRYHLSTKY
ncbi:hypothetical protein TNIN_334961, partial [Trichonephila inaurata madagascariensis]